MEAARHPFPVSSTALHCRRIKSESQDYFEACSKSEVSQLYEVEFRR
jgi:hypothetical protein